jgi:hypothetical protein
MDQTLDEQGNILPEVLFFKGDDDSIYPPEEDEEDEGLILGIDR